MTNIKPLAKRALLIVSIVLTSPIWLLVHGLSLIGRDERFFQGAGQLLSLVPGLSGVFLRCGYYLLTLEAFGTNCSVGFGTWFSHRQARVGNNVIISCRSTIGMVDIGTNSMIGSNVDILSGRHQHGFSDLQRPINQQPGELRRVFIGEDCFIGNGSIVTADIGAKSVIGAGSVVIHDIPELSVAVGNPATVKKYRD